MISGHACHGDAFLLSALPNTTREDHSRALWSYWVFFFFGVLIGRNIHIEAREVNRVRISFGARNRRRLYLHT